MAIPRGGRVLLTGDSITDAGRDRARGDHMGCGYAMMAAASYTAAHPDHDVTFLNRGISGDRVRDLRARWQADCLDLSPGLVSVLIGINDTWRRYSQNDPTGADEFERDYREILERTRQQLDADIVLVEPFLIPISEEQREWRIDLDLKVEVVRKLAAEFDAALVAVDHIFAGGGAWRVWTEDGVHLSSAGHALLAREWLKVVAPDCCATPSTGQRREPGRGSA
ncbi:SGNH/GDSL hydrolase family protein [Micromonospora globbae]|uniref:SGNH/GDSL hydrolase family protein n=1 Tax=Micromonospora globbae TaxID=1894969 RepID=UPI003425CBA8